MHVHIGLTIYCYNRKTGKFWNNYNAFQKFFKNQLNLNPIYLVVWPCECDESMLFCLGQKQNTHEYKHLSDSSSSIDKQNVSRTFTQEQS